MHLYVAIVNIVTKGKRSFHKYWYHLVQRSRCVGLARTALLLLSMLLVQADNEAKAQLVNIETMRLQTDTVGWKGGFGSAFTFLKNVNQVVSVSANAHLQYKTAKNIFLLLADYNVLKSDNEQLSDNMFYHLRYNRKLGEVLRWEVFTQLQRNAVTNIKVRMLAGTGPRFKLHESKKVKLFAATAAMYEYERELTNEGLLHQDIRNTSYVSAAWLPSDVFSLTTTTYYQPLFSNVTDYRVFNQLSLEVKATKHFAITTDWNYLFDNNPAAGVPRYNYSISNGFAYKF